MGGELVRKGWVGGASEEGVGGGELVRKGWVGGS